MSRRVSFIRTRRLSRRLPLKFQSIRRRSQIDITRWAEWLCYKAWWAEDASSIGVAIFSPQPLPAYQSPSHAALLLLFFCFSRCYQYDVVDLISRGWVFVFTTLAYASPSKWLPRWILTLRDFIYYIQWCFTISSCFRLPGTRATFFAHFHSRTLFLAFQRSPSRQNQASRVKISVAAYLSAVSWYVSWWTMPLRVVRVEKAQH